MTTTADLTLEKLLKAKAKLEKRAPLKRLTDPFASNQIGGERIYEMPEIPKLKLREDVNVSESFRQQYNAWLAGRFGYRKSLLGRHETFYVAGIGFVMRPETASMIKATTA